MTEQIICIRILMNKKLYFNIKLLTEIVTYFIQCSKDGYLHISDAITGQLTVKTVIGLHNIPQKYTQHITITDVILDRYKLTAPHRLIK